MRDRMGRRRIIVLAVASVAAAVALGIGLRFGWSRADLIALVVGVALIVLTAAPMFIEGGSDAGILGPEQLADLLAEGALQQWTSAAEERGLEVPTKPIPVRWTRSSLPVAGPVREAVGSTRDRPRFAPLPGVKRVTQAHLRSGQLGDLYNLYGGLDSGRLLILGPPGSGKSGAAILLIRDALRHRQQVSVEDRQRVPVPLLATLGDWDPDNQSIDAWLGRRLALTSALFAGRRGDNNARSLLAAGKIALLLDGLDEMPERRRASALRALSATVKFRVVLLTRSSEMVAVAGETHFVGAAAIELQPVDAHDAADWLESSQRQPAPAGWGELIEHMVVNPQSPVAKALSSPLMLTVVRDTYSDDDVRELLSIETGVDDAAVAQQDIENHLLDQVLPAAYARRLGTPAPPYDLATATRTLHYIAHQMLKSGARDLEWWRIRDWVPRTARVIASGLTTGLVFGLAFGLAFGPGFGVAAALFAAPMVTVTLMDDERPPWPTRVELRPLLNPSAISTGLRYGCFGGLLMGLGVGVQPGGGLSFGLVVGLVSGVVCLLGGWLYYGLAVEIHVRDANVVGPAELWRADILTSLRVAYGIQVGAWGGVIAWAWKGPWAGLAIGLASWLTLSLAWSVSWPSSLAFLQLTFEQGTPLHLMRFLEDARTREVLRTVGPVYQFRHARLQDRIASPVENGTATQETTPNSVP